MRQVNRVCSTLLGEQALTFAGWRTSAGRKFKFSSCSGLRLPEHLTVTSGSPRAKMAHAMEVLSADLITPDVKQLLIGRHHNFKFKPGQWVDFWLDDQPWVGGFSICSTPLEAKEQGTIELVVKRSSWPAASWVHEECDVGTKVNVRVGGSFFYEPEGVYNKFGTARNVLLIAGGVGISPIASIFSHLSQLQRTNRAFRCKRALLYSARGESDLLFKEKFVEEAHRDPGSVRCQFFGTRSVNSDVPSEIKCGRITADDITESLLFLQGTEPPLVFICGPPGLAEAVEDMLHSVGMVERDIFYEKWW